MSVAGLSVEHWLTGPSQQDALAYRGMMQRAGQSIVLADHTAGKVALHRIAPLAAGHIVITNDADAQAIRSIRAAGIEVIAA